MKGSWTRHWGLLGILLFSQALCAQDVEIAIGESLPPYVLGEQDAGLEVDIIREALALKGHQVRFYYSPNLRIPRLIESGRVDGVAVNRAYDVSRALNRKLYPSDTTLTYQNFAITRIDSGREILSVDDLLEPRVMAFHGAKDYMGDRFAEMAARNPEYKENADQAIQPKMLMAGRIDVVVADLRIFEHWYQRAFGSEPELPVRYHPIFPPSPRAVTLVDSQLRDDLNDGLQQLHRSGRYMQLLERYNDL
ncbi:substrate-binding periplasmic protein [Aestuariirhabdus sp. LZHN29]|uniref:substrate-binding periplasmic protein n=1 Tax=Aestuariirhabdus sp. LZHN29 TaxID=3417462 RepID=UPI003CFB45FD